MNSEEQKIFYIPSSAVKVFKCNPLLSSYLTDVIWVPSQSVPDPVPYCSSVFPLICGSNPSLSLSFVSGLCLGAQRWDKVTGPVLFLIFTPTPGPLTLSHKGYWLMSTPLKWDTPFQSSLLPLQMHCVFTEYSPCRPELLLCSLCRL